MTLQEFCATQDHFLRHFHYDSSGFRLNARVSMCGYERPDKALYVWNGLQRGDGEFLLWQCTLSGEGELLHEDEAYRIPPGKAMLVRVPHRHCYRVSPEADHWEFVFLILRGSECMRLGDLILANHVPVSADFAAPALQEIACGILGTPEGDNATGLSETAYRFMMRLADTCKDVQAGTIPPAIQRARKFMLKNFDRALRVDELAGQANMSYAYFCREFTRHFGVAPGAFLLQLRFEKAENLLQHSHLSIKEIAESCGFSGSSYFCRAFAIRFGLPPGDYRLRKKPR